MGIDITLNRYKKKVDEYFIEDRLEKECDKFLGSIDLRHEWGKDDSAFHLVTGIYEAIHGGVMQEGSVLIVDEETLDFMIHVKEKGMKELIEMRTNEGNFEPYEEEAWFEKDIEKLKSAKKEIDFNNETLFFYIE